MIFFVKYCCGEDSKCQVRKEVIVYDFRDNNYDQINQYSEVK